MKLNVPLADGVPEIVPVELPSVSPAGREPAMIAQLYGGEPPVAASVYA